MEDGCNSNGHCSTGEAVDLLPLKNTDTKKEAAENVAQVGTTTSSMHLSVQNNGEVGLNTHLLNRVEKKNETLKVYAKRKFRGGGLKELWGTPLKKQNIGMLSENAADIQLDSRNALFSQECDTTFGSKTEVATAIIINAENGTENRKSERHTVFLPAEQMLGSAVSSLCTDIVEFTPKAKDHPGLRMPCEMSMLHPTGTISVETTHSCFDGHITAPLEFKPDDLLEAKSIEFTTLEVEKPILSGVVETENAALMSPRVTSKVNEPLTTVRECVFESVKAEPVLFLDSMNVELTQEANVPIVKNKIEANDWNNVLNRESSIGEVTESSISEAQDCLMLSAEVGPWLLESNTVGSEGDMSIIVREEVSEMKKEAFALNGASNKVEFLSTEVHEDVELNVEVMKPALIDVAKLKEETFTLSSVSSSVELSCAGETHECVTFSVEPMQPPELTHNSDNCETKKEVFVSNSVSKVQCLSNEVQECETSSVEFKEMPLSKESAAVETKVLVLPDPLLNDTAERDQECVTGSVEFKEILPSKESAAVETEVQVLDPLLNNTAEQQVTCKGEESESDLCGASLSPTNHGTIFARAPQSFKPLGLSLPIVEDSGPTTVLLNSSPSLDASLPSLLTPPVASAAIRPPLFLLTGQDSMNSLNATVDMPSTESSSLHHGCDDQPEKSALSGLCHIAGEEAAVGTEKDRLDTDAGLKEMKIKDDDEVLPMAITQTESTVCEEKNVHEEDAEVPATAELVDDGHIHGCSFMSLMNGDEHVMDTVQDDTNGMSQLESEISVLSEAPEVRVQQLDGITTGLLQSGTLLDTEGTSDTHFLEEVKPNLEGLSSGIQKLGGKCEHARTKWCSKCMVLKKGHHMCRLEMMGNEDGDDSSLMERQDSAMEVGTPPPPLQSPGFKIRLKVKGPVEGALKDVPTTAKQLLASGLLEGQRVRYVGRGQQVLLTGIIQAGGILCNCTECGGLQVVNVSSFEKHAGSSARRPSDYIFLENGNSLHKVLESGWKARDRKSNVLVALRMAIGEACSESSGSKKSCCSKCGFADGELVSCSGASCMNLCHPGRPSVTHCTPVELLRTPTNVSRESSGPNFNKALFLPGGLPDDIELGYYVKGQNYLSGVKKGAGICCSCCQQVISCSLFEQHAGWGSRRNPYGSIYLMDGRCLREAAQSLASQHKVKTAGGTFSIAENVDFCHECGDGGELVLCDGCPAAYHQDCLGLDSVPAGDWYCQDCQLQQSAATGNGHRVVGKQRLKRRTKTLLTKDRITGRCTRLLQVPETVILGGCVFCKSGSFAKTGFGPMTILLCDQCEREFHVGCLKEQGLADLTELPEGEWFCGEDCKHIHSILSLLVANGPEPLADSIISRVLESRQLRATAAGEQAASSKPHFEWQLLHGRQGDPANGRTLAEAVDIFSECFDPIVDGPSGGDLIPLMVYSRTLRDQEFGGMHCVVLKCNDKVVCTAVIRVFGRQLAEVPLVATSLEHQGQGHCKALFLSIERLLGVLRVDRVVLPAAEGAEGIWLNKFGFSKMANDQVQRYRSNFQLMIFSGSSMLEKEIIPLIIS
ncbi:unnamed protein product [Sphagnum tenellum]